jgi:hypothetical protein
MRFTESAQQAEASQLERRLSGPIILWLNLQQSVLPPWMAYGLEQRYRDAPQRPFKFLKEVKRHL